MQQKLNKYLEARGFHANPFATTNAEQERDLLASFFVTFPWFDWLVGEPQRPESLILFAPQGYGKTSHRLEVARLASEGINKHRALVVICDDVNLLLHEETGKISIATYLSFIRRKTLQALKEHYHASPEQMASLQQDTEALHRFALLTRLYAPRKPLHLDVSAHIIKRMMREYEQMRLGPREWLKEELFPLVQRAGFHSVYVLLDGLDESDETRENPGAMISLLKPLLDAPGLLQGCGFAFKLFLPGDLEEQKEQLGRIDRIPHRSLQWNEEKLHEMLHRRLKSLSRLSETSDASLVNRFQDLCEVDFDVDAYLIKAARLSPRRLISLARQIIELHCEKFGGADVQIDAATIAQILADHTSTLLQTIRLPQAAPAAQSSTPSALHDPDEQVVVVPLPSPGTISEPEKILASQSDTTPRLFFNEANGEIWIGSEPRNQLSKLRRRCLAYLWSHRGRTVTYEELQVALYGENYPGTKDNCVKVIKQLREILEPGKPSSQTYIETQRGSGYILRNFHNE